MNAFNYKKNLVVTGKSRIFKNWHEHVGVTQEDFLEALEWVCADPLNAAGKMTREIGPRKDGSIAKLKRVYYDDGSFAGIYEIETDRIWMGKVSINCKDRV